MNTKKKPLYTLLSLLIVLALAVPVLSLAATADPGDFAGGSGTPGDPYQIADWHHLDNVRNHLDSDFILMNDLNAATAGYELLAGLAADGGKGWEPIGVLGVSFTGSFDGQVYEIRDLFIDRDDEDGVGLFGAVDDGGVIQNVGVVSVNVTGSDGVGGLVGDNWGGTVINSYATGSVIGDYSVGGLVGWNAGTVSNCYSSASVTGNDAVGGLVGSSDGVVDYSYSNAIVTGDSFVGGLVGDNFEGLVGNAYSGSTVTGRSDVGGLVGINDGVVSNCYATGDVIGDEYVGGLIGSNRLVSVNDAASGGSIAGNHDSGGQARGRSITIVNSYSDAATSGNPDLVGVMEEGGGDVSNCYAAGSVSGNSNAGGLVGLNEAVVSNSFWDTETSGQAGSAGGTGKATAEMKDITTFTDITTAGLDEAWDMTSVVSGASDPVYTWNIVDGATYPFLSWEQRTYDPVATALEIVPDSDINPVGTEHHLAATVYDQLGAVMEGLAVTWDIEGVGQFVGTPDDSTDATGQAGAVITSDEPGTSTITCTVDGTTVSATATKEWALMPLAEILGQTREVNCAILPGVTVVLYDEHAVEVDSMISDGDGNYTLAVPDLGEYTVVASMAGFRDRERSVSVTELTAYTVDFVADHGLIPDAPNMSYVLACINLWQYGEPHCKLTMSTVLAVINAWQVPILVDEGG